MDDINNDPRDPPFKKKKIIKLIGTCVVCGDKASSMNHYGSKVCFGQFVLCIVHKYQNLKFNIFSLACRAFFRRLAVKGKNPKRENCNLLKSEIGQCEINAKTRQLCRYL